MISGESTGNSQAGFGREPSDQAEIV